jgi:glycosyltransferase involved in cell wall biosynthesis
MDAEEVRLAIAIPERNVVSESFIGLHIEGLFDSPTVLWGSPRPMFIDDEESVLSGSSRAAASVLGYVWRVSLERVHGAIGRRLPDPLYSRLLARFLRRMEAEVVLAEYGPTAVTILDACSISRTPLVVHFHGYDAYRRETVAELRAEYQRLFAAASRVIAVSKDMVGQLVSLGCPAERIVLNPCGVDVDRFVGARPQEGAPLVVACGRFVEKKGPLLTLRAFARAQAEEPQARLVMLGDGPLRKRCIDLACELGVDRVVEFPGAVDHEAVLDWMRRARCFVQHSLRAEDGDSEGTPVAVLEAASCGLPVVSTRHAGIVDAVVDGAGGFLVEEGDVDEMAGHLLRLAQDPGLAARMGVAGRRHIERKYSAENSLGRLRQVLREAAGRDRGP